MGFHGFIVAILIFNRKQPSLALSISSHAGSARVTTTPSPPPRFDFDFLISRARIKNADDAEARQFEFHRQATVSIYFAAAVSLRQPRTRVMTSIQLEAAFISAISRPPHRYQYLCRIRSCSHSRLPQPLRLAGRR